MDNELFGERHEQEEYGLHGRKHAEEQCFLHSVGNTEGEFCECEEPKQSRFPDGKFYCLECWKEWYH